MRSVVHLTSVHPATDNRILHKECRTLAEAGYEVTLIAPHDREVVIEGVRVRPLPGWDSRLLRVTMGVARALGAARSEPADLYHLHDPELLPIAPLLRARNRVVVYDMHEHVPRALRTRTWIAPVLRRGTVLAWRGVERLLLRKVPVVFAERSYARDYDHAEPSVVVENMVRLEVAEIRAPRHPEFTVVYVGVVGEGRGMHCLLDALERVRRTRDKLGFECVGPIRGAAIRRRVGEIAGRGNGRFRFHGRLPFRSAMEIAARGHVGVALLKPYPNFVESFPTKMFEYMALGIPVIVSDFPLYREVVETAECGFCVDPTDPEAVARAIEWLAERPDVAAAMGRRGREAVLREYNWEREGEKLLAFYEELFARS